MDHVNTPKRNLGWRRYPRLILFLALVLGGCASTGIDAVPDDGPPPSVSHAAALSFIQKVLTAGQRATQTKTFDLAVTDTEVTSFLNIRAEITRELEGMGLEQIDNLEGWEDVLPEEVDVTSWQRLLGSTERNNGRRLPRLRLALQEPHVYFTADRHVIARGYITLLAWRQPARIVLAPHADDNELALDFVEGQLGTLPMPKVVFNLIGKGLTEALLLGDEYVEVSRIQVEAGLLTVSGRYKK